MRRVTVPARCPPVAAWCLYPDGMPGSPLGGHQHQEGRRSQTHNRPNRPNRPNNRPNTRPNTRRNTLPNTHATTLTSAVPTGHQHQEGRLRDRHLKEELQDRLGILTLTLGFAAVAFSGAFLELS